METRNITEESIRVHRANANFWVDINNPSVVLKRNIFEMGALAIGELSEALEGYRKNLQDDKLPQYPMAAVEIVDCMIRFMDTVVGLGFTFDQAVFVATTGYFNEDLPFGAHMFLMTKALIATYGELDEAIKVIELCNDFSEEEQRKLAKHASYRIHDLLFVFRHFYPRIDPWEVYEAKMKFNAEREDHKLEHRRGKHGKKF